MCVVSVAVVVVIIIVVNVLHFHRHPQSHSSVPIPVKLTKHPLMNDIQVCSNEVPHHSTSGSNNKLDEINFTIIGTSGRVCRKLFITWGKMNRQIMSLSVVTFETLFSMCKVLVKCNISLSLSGTVANVSDVVDSYQWMISFCDLVLKIAE